MKATIMRHEENLSFYPALVRGDFPVLTTARMRGQSVAYLDNGATTQKPMAVIEAMRQFDTERYATVHRGSYQLAERATQMYEGTRETVARFIGARDGKEIVYTSGATAAINLVAHGWGRKFVAEGDEILISAMEHHANIVPWQFLAKERGAHLRVIPMDAQGVLRYDLLAGLIGSKTKIVAITHVSNALGTINRVREITALAREVGAVTLVDGAQAVPHMPIDVTDIGCDFYVFSAHKMYGPTGVGILYGRYDILESMNPFLGGGDMIREVTFEKSSFMPPPYRFEAGTPPITQVVGLGAAIDYLESVGRESIATYEHELLLYGESLLREIPGLRIIGEAENKAGLISFVLDGIHPHDVVTVLGDEGVALRGGHHCAQPTMERFSVPATSRASLSFYNNRDDLDRLAAGLRNVVTLFG